MIVYPSGGSANEVPRGERKLPCVLLVPTSGDMRYYEDDLREGIERLVSKLRSDPATADLVELMLILFDDEARIAQPFTGIRSFEVPEFSSGGMSRMFTALDLAYDEIRTRQEQCKDEGILSLAPFLVVLCSGRPVGDVDTGIVLKIRDRNLGKKLVPLPFALGIGADERLLMSLRADGMAFRVEMDSLGDVFEFVYEALSCIAYGKNALTGDRIPETITFISPSSA